MCHPSRTANEVLDARSVTSCRGPAPWCVRQRRRQRRARCLFRDAPRARGHIAGAGAAGAIVAGGLVLALTATFLVGMADRVGCGRPARVVAATTTPGNAPVVATGPAATPITPITPITIEAHRLDVILDGPDGQYGDANTYLHTELPRCLPLAGRRPGPVLHYVVWLTSAGAVDRIERRTEVMSSTEQACVENAIRAARWPPPTTSRPIANVSVNALF
jgi:hypothetical protein